MFSQSEKVTAADPVGKEVYPSSGAQVVLLQQQLNSLPEVTPKLQEDGGHGPLTSTAINQATGLDGNYYGPAQYRALDVKLHPPGGVELPKEVILHVPAQDLVVGLPEQALTADVVVPSK